MKELKEAYDKFKAACGDFEKAMTNYQGVKVEKNQDGNRGNTTNGEESYADAGDFDNLSKEQIFKQKLLTMKD